MVCRPAIDPAPCREQSKSRSETGSGFSDLRSASSTRARDLAFERLKTRRQFRLDVLKVRVRIEHPNGCVDMTDGRDKSAHFALHHFDLALRVRRASPLDRSGRDRFSSGAPLPIAAPLAAHGMREGQLRRSRLNCVAVGDAAMILAPRHFGGVAAQILCR